MQGVSNPGRTGTNANLGYTATAQCIARILREFREIQRTPSPHWCANPLQIEEPYEWHFTLRGPQDSHFEGGLYHGRIVLPKNYPFAPPNLVMLTQNGRFEVGKKVCLSASSYHPELWQPAWGIRTLLDALCAFFPTPAGGALHSLDRPEKVRRQLALESVNWLCPTCGKSNKELVEAACAAPTSALPDLPEPLRQQAQLRTDQESQAAPLQVADESGSRVESSRRGGTAVAAVQQRQQERSVDAAFVSSAGNAESTRPPRTSAPREDPPRHRRRPQRGHRTLMAQLLQTPFTRGEFIVAAADLVLLLLVLASVVLLADLFVNPPKVTMYGSSGAGGKL
ncbi:ubiquitin-conjugating enzyme subfamily protein [Toxoplasma gondii ARI]|uniref:Ubiquitin-conjugating enzyme subfamily protein n=2 Tax=Toxoplasma gondii TaxID=5811 RepID=A0A2G8XQD0_TOXGO|nr:ubiquitin-conjugating enzyme subfamily protein [Toxoplasma gondii ARI]PIL97241.1 ubiquitin-conjugating enzyme subfamily protein [Toxoplasma gondii COUG]